VNGIKSMPARFALAGPGRRPVRAHG
jgi:hypothetical protein